MKGLIYKDFLSLRKNMRTFLLVSVGTVIVGIMFLLSCQYGNLAVALASEAEMDAINLAKTMELAMWLVVMLPIGFITEIHNCFKEDARVGFHKVLSGAALTEGQIVGSRYLTTVIYGGCGILMAMMSGFFVRLVPVEGEMGNYFAGAMTVGAMGLIYMSFYLFLVYMCGSRKADLVQMIPIVLLVVVEIVLVIRVQDMNISEEAFTRLLLEWGDKIADFLERGYLVLIPAAVVTMLVSYAGSVAVMKRRRRVL